LVVVAIIAVLIAILLPALSRSREQARRVVCLSNLHQWAFAFSTYALDNNDRYIPAAIEGSTSIRPGSYRFSSEEEMKSFTFYKWSIGSAKAFWSCPNLAAINAPNPPWSWEGTWFMETGYQYCGDGGKTGLNWAGWGRDAHAPHGPGDPSEWNLINDWCYRTNYPGFWVTRYAGHLQGGAGVYWADVFPYGIGIEPGGGNQLFNDGSGRWYDFSSLSPVWNGGGWVHYWYYQ
jgi:Tfp pilus assembly protein PilE